MQDYGLYIVIVVTRPVGGYAYEEEEKLYVFDDLEKANEFKAAAPEKFGDTFRKAYNVKVANRMF